MGLYRSVPYILDRQKGRPTESNDCVCIGDAEEQHSEDCEDVLS